MKKVGIITIHNSPNYGACLQSFALFKYIEMQGCDVEIIDLHRPYANDDYVPSKKYIRSRITKVSLKGVIKRKILKLLGIQHKRRSLYSKEAFQKINDFNSQIRLSKAYKCIDELYENPPKYDLYISGSDQLWNPTQAYCLEPYFLTFVPENYGKKISFATSIGISELREEEKQNFKEWLSKYDDVSVREDNARTLLKSFIDRDIKQISDPTFLLDINYWQSIAVKPKINTKYIFLFTLQYNQILIDYCKKLCYESGLRLIVLGQIQPDVKDNSYIAIKDAGPKEFLGYISDAELVITDSFHCTVFSLIMGTKNFYSYIATNNKRGSRIVDLLNTFNLSDHLLNCELNLSFNRLQNHMIERDKVISIINKENRKSCDYLNPYIQ